MATYAGYNTFNLSQDQEDLLLAALSSNPTTTNTAELSPPSRETFTFSNGSLESPLFGGSPANDTVANTDFSAMTDQQFMEFMENGDVAGYDHNDMDDEEEESQENGFDSSHLHDKRKSVLEMNDNDEENSAKRHEGEEKQAKKPGRKPLTSEPTSKRKAQNRAAQRAFRERKEKHLKDLETKVSELEKLSESQNHENSLLRAQVERQQTELRAYKKRLSFQSQPTLSSFSMPTPAVTSTNTMMPNSFAFDFPQFNSLSYLPIDTSSGQGLFDLNMTASPTTVSRHGSTDFFSNINMAPSPAPSGALRSLHSSISGGSPLTNPSNSLSGTSDKLPTNQGIWGSSGYNIFMPNSSPRPNLAQAPQLPRKSSSASSQLKSSESSDSIGRGHFHFNTGDAYSPSTTASQNGPSSSCETSPESTTHATTSIKEEQVSPAPAKASESETALNTATGTDQQFGAFSSSNLRSTGAENQPLWVDMPSTNMMGDGSFTGGFFNDTMPGNVFDYNPMDWSDLIGGGAGMKTGLTPAISTQPRTNPMDDLNIMPSIAEDHTGDSISQPKKQPTEGVGQLCNKIWESIKARPELQNASDVEMDALCKELRTKAKCSEAGPVIDQKDIDAALERRMSSMTGSPSVTPY